MGRYVPPDLEGTTSGNRLNKKRAPGTARKDGTQTVRFELPYAVWCHTCSPHAIIGQGVRFNAEKKKVGYYYSTPIWQFTLKHVACGGKIVVKTDPKETRYVVVEGGKERDYGEQVREGEGGVPILTDAERERRREDAFAALEGKEAEKRVVEESKDRVEGLYRARQKDWGDTWSANRRIRDTFRRERKVRARKAEKTAALQDRIGTDMELLPETEDDARRAKLVDFAGAQDHLPEAKALFRDATTTSGLTKPSKSRKENRADALRKQLVGNTRAAMNPFDSDT